MKKLVLLVFSFLLSSISFSQSRVSVGVQGGISTLHTNSTSSGADLSAFSPVGTPSGVGQVLVKYSLKKNWFVGAGFGVMHFGMSTTLNGIKGGTKSLGGQTLNPQLMASFGKDFYFGESKWGTYISAGISTTRLSINGERVYSLISEEGIRFQGVMIREDQSTVSELLAHDMRVFQTRKDAIWHIRPEVGIFRKLGKNRVYASFTYGLALGEGLYSVSYNSISFKGERYSEFHGATGSFFAAQLGYQIYF
jgi:hypothetical protein